MADNNFWNVPTVKSDIHEKISDIKNCQYSSSSVATDIVPAICYLSNMKDELKTNDLKTAEMNTVKVMCSRFSPDLVKDALKKYSVLAKSYNIDKIVDVISKNVEKTKRKLDYKVSSSQTDISKDKLGREASCKEVYLQARNEVYTATGATGHADYVALERMVGKFPVDEIKKTFRENSPLFVGDPKESDRWVDQSIPLVKRDRERGITEKKLAAELKEARQLMKMELRGQNSNSRASLRRDDGWGMK